MAAAEDFGGGLEPGMYKGPRCPQAASALASTKIAASRGKTKNGFTIRIRVDRKLLECSMTESEFMTLADATLQEIEQAFEGVASDVDVECTRSGNVLEIEFVDKGTKIIVNSQTPMREIWVAAKSGGFHFKQRENQWVDTRDGTELFAALSNMASAQAGIAITLAE